MKKEQPVETSAFLFVLECGKFIRVEYPENIFDELWEEIESAWLSRRIWWTGNFVNVTATYYGQAIESINMSMVVGIV